jgi:hypothetical protein
MIGGMIGREKVLGNNKTKDSNHESRVEGSDGVTKTERVKINKSTIGDSYADVYWPVKGLNQVFKAKQFRPRTSQREACA